MLPTGILKGANAMSSTVNEIAISPLVNGQNGRDSTGRFVQGCKGGPGNPLARKIHRLRSALLKRCSVDDINEVADTLIAEAKSGDIVAIRELLDRILGKAKVGIELSGPAEDTFVQPNTDLVKCMEIFARHRQS